MMFTKRTTEHPVTGTPEKDQIIDLDLDYFNYANRFGGSPDGGPMAEIDKWLKTFNRSIPYHFFIEHQHVLEIMAAKDAPARFGGPVHWFNIDHHFDWCGPSKVPMSQVTCGNYCGAVPDKVWKAFTHVTPRGDNGKPNRIIDAYQDLVKKAEKAKKPFNFTTDWTWQRDKVILIMVTISPDYLQLGRFTNAAVQMIADYFGVRDLPVMTEPIETRLSAWTIRTRDVVPRRAD